MESSNLEKHIKNPKLVKKLTTDWLLTYMRILNAAYRRGDRMVPDTVWDYYWEGELDERDPERTIDRVQFF